MDIGLELIHKLNAKAVEHAGREFKRPISIAVCDTHGMLVSFLRMPGAILRSIRISQAKAYTAVYMTMNTDAFAERLRREKIPASFFADERLTGLAGGAVLKNSAGEVIGAVGISGLAAQEDQVIADALAEWVRQNE